MYFVVIEYRNLDSMHSYITAKESIGALHIAHSESNFLLQHTRKTRLGKSMIYALIYFRALLDKKNDNVVGIVSGLVGMSFENDECLAELTIGCLPPTFRLIFVRVSKTPGKLDRTFNFEGKSD